MNKSLTVNFLLFLVIILFPGCNNFMTQVKTSAFKGTKKVNAFVDTENRMNINRILVMPVINNSEEKNIENRVYKLIIFELSAFKYFEVLKYSDFPPENILELNESIKEKSGGIIDAKTIKIFGEQFNIDAVIIPEMTFYNSYRPLVFGYKHVMIKNTDGNTVWSVDDLFKMADRNVNNMAKAWYSKNYAGNVNPSLNGDLMEISMENFIRFSFSVIFETWSE